MSIIEQSVRLKSRFTAIVKHGAGTRQVIVATEDLYDLSEPELNDIYERLGRELKAASVDSLISPSSGASDLQLKMEVVRHVFLTKRAEAEALKERANKAKDRQYWLKVKQEKLTKMHADLSMEEIDRHLAE